MKNIILIVCMFFALTASSYAQRTPQAGMLYFASYGYDQVTEVIENPNIIGGFYSIYWAEVEIQKGKYDWSKIDNFIKNWNAGGKKVVLRIMWSSSGYWKHTLSGTPTPKWVWAEGAKYAFHEKSKTELPLFWDPIFNKNALNFLRAVAQRYDNNPNILFIDVTPGAETNPYRFGTIDRIDPGFKKDFVKIKTSDGRNYSNDLWVSTVTDWIKQTSQIFKSLPCLITLNIGSLKDANNFEVIGQCAVDNGMYVGQNGLNESSYKDNDNVRKELFLKWSERTKLVFEMVHAAETSNTGTLKGVMEAAQRINCSYLNVYAIDVIKGSKNMPEKYTPRFAEALEYGAIYFDCKK